MTDKIPIKFKNPTTIIQMKKWTRGLSYHLCCCLWSQSSKLLAAFFPWQSYSNNKKKTSDPQILSIYTKKKKKEKKPHESTLKIFLYKWQPWWEWWKFQQERNKRKKEEKKTSNTFSQSAIFVLGLLGNDRSKNSKAGFCFFPFQTQHRKTLPLSHSCWKPVTVISLSACRSLEWSRKENFLLGSLNPRQENTENAKTTIMADRSIRSQNNLLKFN